MTGVAVAALYGGTGVSGAPALGQTPGTYSFYGFGSTRLLSSVDFGTTVTADPGRANVFWSAQFSLADGNGGYVGFQRFRVGSGQFLFSVWGAHAGVRGSPGTYCEPFQEGGDGYSCRRAAAFVAGDPYRLAVTPTGAAGWLAVTITDARTHVVVRLGSVEAGSDRAGVHIEASSTMNWVEYFDWNKPEATCADEPYSSATFRLPVGVDAASGRPVRASLTGTNTSHSCRAAESVIATPAGIVQRDGIGASTSGHVRDAGRCLDAAGGGPESPVAATLAPCRDEDSENFVLAQDGTIHALFACLGAPAGAGTVVQLSGCGAAPTQRWGRRGSELVNRGSGRCLTAGTRQTTVAPCRNTPAQRWSGWTSRPSAAGTAG